MIPLIRATTLRLATVATALSLLGCMTTRLVSTYDSDTFANNPVNRRTTWTYAWGLVQPKDINPGCDRRFNHLNRVTVKTNLGFVLISAATLGLVVPQRVEWACAPYVPPVDTLGMR